ncbi:hypothetical protein HZH68_007574 [Vespula germanica]|uniref:Uncharacterized protein n=1 Tax=Vespula germanica TaxID=30212 RepID=A0A834K770_VESGE|nr:hypothetical protein HZH68_007574 [Vespula germanica]
MRRIGSKPSRTGLHLWGMMRGARGRVSFGDLEQLDGSSSAFREIPEEDPSTIHRETIYDEWLSLPFVLDRFYGVN